MQQEGSCAWVKRHGASKSSSTFCRETDGLASPRWSSRCPESCGQRSKKCCQYLQQTCPKRGRAAVLKWGQFGVGTQDKQLLMNETALATIVQINQHRFFGFGDCFFSVAHFQRPDWICGSFPFAFKLARLVEIAHNHIRGQPFSVNANGSVTRSRGMGIKRLFFGGLNGFFDREASDFAVMSRDHSRKPTTHSEDLWPASSHISTAYWCLNMRSAKGAVESLHDCLVPVNLCAPTSNVCLVFFHFFHGSCHEFSATVNHFLHFKGSHL